MFLMFIYDQQKYVVKRTIKKAQGTRKQITRMLKLSYNLSKFEKWTNHRTYRQANCPSVLQELSVIHISVENLNDFLLWTDQNCCCQANFMWPQSLRECHPYRHGVMVFFFCGYLKTYGHRQRRHKEIAYKLLTFWSLTTC